MQAAPPQQDGGRLVGISKAFITRDAADIGAAAAAHAAANGFARKQAAFVTKRAVPAVLAHLSGKRRV